MCKLKLVRLDFSCNRITVIPTTFRFLTTLTDLVLDNNPLQSPPAQVICFMVHSSNFLTVNCEELGENCRHPLRLSYFEATMLLSVGIMVIKKQNKFRKIASSKLKI